MCIRTPIAQPGGSAQEGRRRLPRLLTRRMAASVTWVSTARWGLPVPGRVKGVCSALATMGFLMDSAQKGFSASRAALRLLQGVRPTEMAS